MPKLFRWDGDLALELPSEVVAELNLQEGDDVELQSLGPGVLGVSRSIPKDDLPNENGDRLP